MEKSNHFPHAVFVKPLEGFKLYLEYEDGIKGEVDLSNNKDNLIGKWWSENDNFSKVHLGGCDCIAWNDEIEFDGFNCYLTIIGKTYEEYKLMSE